MSIVIALILGIVAFGIAREFARVEAGRPPEVRLYSFLVDPLVPFLLVGFLIARLSLITKKGARLGYAAFRKRKRLVDTGLWVFFLAWIVGMEAPAYFNLIGHPFDHARTGNDFMWNGYIEWIVGHPIVNATIPTYHSLGMNLLAIGLLFVQAGALWFGKQLAYMTAHFDDLDRWSKPNTSAPRKK